MKASELRIGNKAFYKEKVVEIASVSGIKYSFGNQDITISTSDNSLLSVDILQLQPIHLTPELLEKCGLVYDGEYFTIKNSYLELKPIEDGKFQLTINSAEYEAKSIVEYLHQLQNLYFALTGRELEIDLKTLQQ